MKYFDYQVYVNDKRNNVDILVNADTHNLHLLLILHSKKGVFLIIFLYFLIAYGYAVKNKIEVRIFLWINVCR